MMPLTRLEWKMIAMTQETDHLSIERWQADPGERWRPLPPGWQRYAAELHEGLLKRWQGRLAPGEWILKTDLFEEATGEDAPAWRMRAMGWRPLGTDVGRGIVRTALRRGAPAMAAVCDVRRLAFAPGTIPAIFCNSTLDHFEHAGEIDVALGELWRVLRPGGLLMLTLDNPRHPVVALRNALPRRLTDALGITNFHVGPTLALDDACRCLAAIGFEILESSTFMHVLRYLALARLRRMAADPDATEREVHRMLERETRALRPGAQRTGHFIFVHARKPEVPS